MGEWLPGAVATLQLLDSLGFDIVIHSCRTAPTVPGSDTDLRNPDDVESEIVGIEKKLEAVGLGHLTVWTRPFKPPAVAYIDNNAIGFVGSWKAVADRLSTERHPNSQRFHELLSEAGVLHDRKQFDYGRGDDPFANVRASEEWGLPGWIGAMVRLTDKVRRLQSLATKGELANEAAKDSFMDIAVYALIAHVLFEESHHDKG